MDRQLDMNKPVHDLVAQYPEVADIMKGLGFDKITNPAMLNSMGRFVTIPKGAAMNHIPLSKIKEAFEKAGFEVIGMPQEGSDLRDYEPSAAHVPVNNGNKQDEPASHTGEEERLAKLKSYLGRLGEGESLESVRRDFVENFKDVDPSEIMKAEQSLIAEGAPITQVQQLCDVHSALFHGSTREEKIANAEKAVQSSLEKKEAQSAPGSKMEKTALLISIPGHPLATFTKENEALEALLTKIDTEKDKPALVQEDLKKVREISIHYAKKGDLLYPVLNVRYGITGPSDVMWSVDDEIRDEIGKLVKENCTAENWMNRTEKVLQRAKEMIYKESNILFPICAVNFTQEEWKQIYRDSKDYAPCLGVVSEVWADAEAKETSDGASQPSQHADEIVMPGGHLTLEQLTALLNTIPLEISFVDAQNINRYFNEGPKVFKRPAMAIDREVFTCHPPKVAPMVRKIIDDFRSGRADAVPVWMNKNGRTMLVKYMAVRDRDGKYLGTVELVQDMEEARKHFTDKA